MQTQPSADLQRLNGFRTRRQLLKWSGLLGLLFVNPALAFNLNKLLKSDDKSKDDDQIGNILKGTGNILASQQEMDYKSEFAIGESLALEGFRRYGLPVENKSLQRYVNLVGNSVARNSSRPQIPYYFVIVDSELHNAFACPGGIIFVSSALMALMDDEAELAAVLAHEVAHVSHKHALQSLKRAKLMQGIGQVSAASMKGEEGEKIQAMIGGLQTILFDKGLDKNMEYEADASSLEFAYRTGYDPRGMERVLRKLKQKQKGAKEKGSWFSTHPPLESRISKVKAKVQNYAEAGSLATVAARFKEYKSLL
jgi:predicted Zn-dependent protease